MDFNKTKSNIENKINRVYEEKKKKAESIIRYEGLDSLMTTEEKEINNYSMSVNDELVNQVEQYILNKYGVDKLEEFKKKYKFTAPKFNKYKFKESDIYTIKTTVRTKKVVVEDTSKNMNSSGLIAVGAGVLLGGLLGKAIAPENNGTMVGAAIGLVAGGAMNVLLSNNKESGVVEKQIKDEKKEIDKQKIIKQLEDRKNQVKQTLLNHTIRIEYAFNEFK